jgi:hypothetical protein
MAGLGRPLHVVDERPGMLIGPSLNYPICLESVTIARIKLFELK